MYDTQFGQMTLLQIVRTSIISPWYDRNAVFIWLFYNSSQYTIVMIIVSVYF